MYLRHCAIAFSASIGIAACSTAHIDTGATAAAEALYDSLYPDYAEICAVSELKKKPGSAVDISSALGGHSILYLNGVCRDRQANYPTIRLCDTDTPPEERGVGLSVNAHFKNANWVATEGRDFIFHGALQPGERLTQAVYDRTQQRAKQKGIYAGVEFHEEVFDEAPPGMSRRDYMYEISVATDYAIGFGRDRYCARVPLDRAKMTKVVDYLNHLNTPYRNGKVFDWNVLNNNCSHVAHNALAVAALWESWATERFLPFAAFDFPVPKNEFVNMMRRTNDMSIDDIDALYGDEAARQALLRMDSLPTQPGALADAEPAAQDNDIYDTDLRLIFYDDPIFGSYRRHFERIYSEPRYIDLRANLQHFADLYTKIEQERRPLSSLLARHGALSARERDDLAAFYARYYRYIERQNSWVQTALTSLSKFPVAVAAGSRQSDVADTFASLQCALPPELH